MANPNPFSNSTHSVGFNECSWDWLQARLVGAPFDLANQGLNEWMSLQLLELEKDFASMVTLDSQKLAAGSLVKARR